MRTRRNFLQLASLAATAAYIGAPGMPRFAFGQSAGGKVYIKMFMRGGADGLHLFPRYGDPFYYQYRPNIAIEGPGSGS
ncbi:MAG: twin-arginine translocation signal domain-containing protein, partial [Pseudomonadota bacterium]